MIASMRELTGSFDEMSWEATGSGVREKKIVIGDISVRMLKIDDSLEHPEWCVTGHTGFVIDGSLVLNIDGNKKLLEKGDVFVVNGSDPSHRHIPMVPEGGQVQLLLVEEK